VPDGVRPDVERPRAVARGAGEREVVRAARGPGAARDRPGGHRPAVAHGHLRRSSGEAATRSDLRTDEYGAPSPSYLLSPRPAGATEGATWSPCDRTCGSPTTTRTRPRRSTPSTFPAPASGACSRPPK